MPEELKVVVDEQAARLGLTQAEYLRAAVYAFAAWQQALDAVDAGASTEDLRDPIVAARMLGR